MKEENEKLQKQVKALQKEAGEKTKAEAWAREGLSKRVFALYQRAAATPPKPPPSQRHGPHGAQ